MFEPGTQVGRYEIQRRLGRGGMGTVYVAHDPVLGRMVAIKIFAGDLDVPDARERFSREARAAAALNHPSIVTVYDFGEYDAQPYIVMEYVPGDTLANLIRRKVSVSMADKLRWMEELCAGANYAHQMSVVHRDIKPANLMIDRSGRLKILDFGIARMLGIASNTSVMIGTPGYMAPEQITGTIVDHRADQFSIGVVFYEMLAYTEAFPGDSLPMITHKILSEEPAALDTLVPDVSPDLSAIVMQALRKNSSDRFRDTDALRAAIARARRLFASDSDWDTPTMAPGRDHTPTAGMSRGTGSARRRTNDAVGVATPPPDPRRTDREALARRRTQQLDAALVLARSLFEQQQLDGALDACQQALTLDEAHIGALELEEKIQAAIRLRDGDSAFDGAETTADQPFADSRMQQSQAVTRFNQEEFAFSGLLPGQPEPQITGTPRPVIPGIGEPTVMRPAASATPATDATVLVPARRSTPVPVARPVAPQPPLPAPPLSTAKPEVRAKQESPINDEATKQVPAAKRAQPAVNAQKVPAKEAGKAEKKNFFGPVMNAITSALKSIGPIVGAATQTASGAKGAKGKSTALWAGVGVGVLAVVGVAVFMMTRGPVPTGTAVIDAVPWATVTAIEDEDGQQVAVPAQASTPLSLTLPAGMYQITLTRPGSESNSQRVSVRIEAGGSIAVPLTRFRSVTAEEYFEQYLGSSVETGAASTSAPAEAASAAGPATAQTPTGTNP